MIITRTPVRIPLGGGGTDLRSYYEQHGGLIVAASVDKYIHLVLNPRFDKTIRVSYSRTEVVDHVDQIEHELVREAMRLTRVTGGVEIISIADVPASSGLGSSSAFTVGVLHALHVYRRESISRYQLAEEACQIEIDVLRQPIGKQDQYAAALGGFQTLEISREGEVVAAPLALPENFDEELSASLLFFFTGVQRSAAEVLRAQDEATRRADDQMVANLHEVKRIGAEIHRALERGDIERLGSLFDEHWALKQRRAGTTTPVIDAWYRIARDAGALGGKLMGAGGGGFFMFVCAAGQKSAVRSALTAAGLTEVRMRFDTEGTRLIYNA